MRASTSIHRPVGRADLLRGDAGGRRRPIRPPWALPESRFTERCTGCGACVEACPEGILRRARGRLPVVEFRAGECTFCGDCVRACSDGALVRSTGDRPWMLIATIGGDCLARRGVECRVCGERCEARAIGFRLVPGRVASPEVDPGACTGCGACAAPCPVGAVSVGSAL